MGRRAAQERRSRADKASTAATRIGEAPKVGTAAPVSPVPKIARAGAGCAVAAADRQFRVRGAPGG